MPIFSGVIMDGYPVFQLWWMRATFTTQNIECPSILMGKTKNVIFYFLLKTIIIEGHILKSLSHDVLSSFILYIGIEFDEFLGMYRRLFVLCRGVVSHDVSDIAPSHRIQV